MDDEKRPIEPIPEGYVGHNNPYRGTEPHGVPHGDDAILPDDLEDDVNPPIHYEKPIDLPDPIAVRIVQEYSRERRHHREYGFSCGTTPFQVLARNDNRKRVVLKNVGAGTIRYSHDIGLLGYRDGAPQTNNFVLGAASREDIYSTEPIYVVSDSDAPTTMLSIMEEYVIDESD